LNQAREFRREKKGGLQASIEELPAPPATVSMSLIFHPTKLLAGENGAIADPHPRQVEKHQILVKGTLLDKGQLEPNDWLLALNSTTR